MEVCVTLVWCMLGIHGYWVARPAVYLLSQCQHALY